MVKYMMTMRHSTAESTASTPEALNGFYMENELLASTIKLADKFLSVKMMEATVFHRDQYILFTSKLLQVIMGDSFWRIIKEEVSHLL